MSILGYWDANAWQLAQAANRAQLQQLELAVDHFDELLVKEQRYQRLVAAEFEGPMWWLEHQKILIMKKTSC
jgi:hypothetical protein